jgi:signal recognition particle subunit SRP68
LKKALGHAEQLQELGRESPRLDERTKLEIEAYASFIFASFHFEMQHWEEAMKNFKNAQSIYAQIARVLGDHPEAAIYNEKSNELLPSMRFCAYQTGADLNISELTAQFQSAAIEAMIAQRPKMSEVNFRGYKITVPTEKIQALLVRIEDFEKKESVKVEDYEEILVELRDAIQAVRDLVKPEQQTAKTKPSMMLSYLLYLRLKLTNSRTELLLKEKSQPKDSIRLIEMVLHNFSEMKTIPELDNDDDFQLEVDNSIAAYKGIRCRYLADVYNSSKKYTEALLLYNKSLDYLQQALKSKPTEKNLLENIAKAQSYAKSASIECRAQIVLSDVNDDEDVDSVLKLRRPKEPLIDRLNEFVLDESLVSGEPNVAVFPPDFKPVPCKPLFFDLALNHIKVPASLEEKAGLSPKKGADGVKGITGFVKGLWGWGK